MPKFTILLAPSEGKQAGGNPFAPDMFDYRSSNTFNYFHELNPERRRLIDTLQHAVQSDQDLENLFGVKGAFLEDAVDVNMTIYSAPLMAALDRYNPGVMYKAMDFNGLPTGAQRRLLENGIIFSGLFGLLRPDDLIPNYRLSMAATLPELGRLINYWRPVISPVLNRTVKDHFVWNLLPTVHREAWEDDHSYAQMVHVNFFVERDGKRSAMTHGVKPLRGQLVNFIVRETLEDLELLKTWQHPAGYEFDEEATAIDDKSKIITVAMVKKS